MDEKKLNILKDLILDEEHTLEDLRRLVEKSKSFLKIESKTGNVIISTDFPFTVNERIILCLIGIYFSKELGLNQDVQITSRFISEAIDIAQTSISGPLGEYVRRNIVGSKENSYAVKYHEIEKQLDLLVSKYLAGVKNSVPTLSPASSPRQNKRKQQSKPKKRIIKTSDSESTKSVNEELFQNELQKHNLSRDDIDSLVNIVDNNILLTRGWKSPSDKESQVKSTLMLLTVNKLMFGEDEMPSSELRKSLMYSGVQLKSHSTALKNYAMYIVHKRGPIGSTKTSYRITPLGFQKGIVLVKDIIQNTKNFDLEFKHKVRSESAESISTDKETLDNNISSFCKQIEISEDRLRTLFDFQEEGVRISSPLGDASRKILQIKTLMLLGVLIKKVYDCRNFSGKEVLKSSRVTYDRLDLLNANRFYKLYFSLNKPKAAMQLTYAGERKALEMLKEYLKSEKCEL